MDRRHFGLLAVAAGLIAGGALQTPSAPTRGASAPSSASQPGDRHGQSMAQRVFNAITGGGKRSGFRATTSSLNGGHRRGFTPGKRHASLRSRSRRRSAAARAKRARRG